MKNFMKVSAFALLISSGLLFACTSSSNKVENAKENVEEAKSDVNEANKELNEANADYVKDMEAYRLLNADRVAANEKSIADFKIRIEKEKRENRAEYNKKLAELEAKNSDMKKKLDDYKGEGKDGWDKFKAEFNRDMDELGQAFKDLTVKNVK